MLKISFAKISALAKILQPTHVRCSFQGNLICNLIWIEVELSRIAAEASSQTQFVSLQLLAGSKDTALQPLAKIFHIADLKKTCQMVIGEDHIGDGNIQSTGTM